MAGLVTSRTSAVLFLAVSSRHDRMPFLLHFESFVGGRKGIVWGVWSIARCKRSVGCGVKGKV